MQASRKVPRMTRGHYNFIADTLAEIASDDELMKCLSSGCNPGNVLAIEFANRLAETNPRFSKGRFIDYVSDYNVRKLKAAAKQMREVGKAA